LILAICTVTLSCDSNPDLDIQADSVIGFWSRETVYLNGVNSDFLSGHNSFLEIKKDKTFYRPYDIGTWHLLCNTLNLERAASSGMGNWTYKIIDHTKDYLTLEINPTEGQYCCGFDEFTDNEIITIKEVYKKVN
jgi:hypothetical protein